MLLGSIALGVMVLAGSAGLLLAGESGFLISTGGVVVCLSTCGLLTGEVEVGVVFPPGGFIWGDAACWG